MVTPTALVEAGIFTDHPHRGNIDTHLHIENEHMKKRNNMFFRCSLASECHVVAQTSQAV